MLLSTSIFCLLLPSASIHSHLLPATSIYFWSAPIYPQLPPSSPICFYLLPSTSISCLPHLLPPTALEHLLPHCLLPPTPYNRSTPPVHSAATPVHRSVALHILLFNCCYAAFGVFVACHLLLPFIFPPSSLHLLC